MDYRFNPKLTWVKRLKLITLLSHYEIALNLSASGSCAISVCEESSLCTNWTNLLLLVPVPQVPPGFGPWCLQGPLP